MIPLIQMLFFLLCLPFLLFGVVLGKISSVVCAVFQPLLLIVSVWFTFVASWLFAQSLPSDAPWETIVETFARSSLLGVSTPVLVYALAGISLIAAFIARRRNPLY